MFDIQIFTFNDNEVRVIDRDGEPWWVLKDVYDVLEFSNPTIVSDRLDDDEKDILKTKTDLVLDIPNRGVTIINESGLHSVILRSDKPEAKPFRRWITHEVLPSIRKHGIYATDDESMKTLMRELRDAKNTLLIHQQQIDEMTAKSGYYDTILNSKYAMTITAIAKDYGKSASWLNKRLHELGVQYKQGDIWLLYQKYAANGYTKTRTHNYIDRDGVLRPKVHTYLTQKRRLFIYELLKSNGELPLVEVETNDEDGRSWLE